MTMGDILVLAVLGALVGWILGSLYRGRKKGNRRGCCGCPHAGTCRAGGSCEHQK